MGLSSSLMCRLLHCHWAGIVTFVAMVLLSLMRRCLCSPGIFAIIMITVLPLLQWHCCRYQADVAALVTMVSLSSLMRRHLCRCHDDVVALVAMAQLPTLHGHCCPFCPSVVVIIPLTSCPHVAWESSALLHRHCYPHQAGVFAMWSVGITIYFLFRSVSNNNKNSVTNTTAFVISM